jgi:hypothetical protein
MVALVVRSTPTRRLCRLQRARREDQVQRHRLQTAATDSMALSQPSQAVHRPVVAVEERLMGLQPEPDWLAELEEAVLPVAVAAAAAAL